MKERKSVKEKHIKQLSLKCGHLVSGWTFEKEKNCSAATNEWVNECVSLVDYWKWFCILWLFFSIIRYAIQTYVVLVWCTIFIEPVYIKKKRETFALRLWFDYCWLHYNWPKRKINNKHKKVLETQRGEKREIKQTYTHTHKSNNSCECVSHVRQLETKISATKRKRVEK